MSNIIARFYENGVVKEELHIRTLPPKYWEAFRPAIYLFTSSPS
jgi:hypothetical protein